MTLWLAQGIVTLAGLYVAAGLLFALWFVIAGLARVDESAREASWALCLLLLPGAVAFWPLLAWRSFVKQ